MKNETSFPLWKAQIETIIINTIRAQRRAGTTGMGADNLYQVCVHRFPRNGGPDGTNAAWMARQIFNAVLAELPAAYRSHVLPELRQQGERNNAAQVALLKQSDAGKHH